MNPEKTSVLHPPLAAAVLLTLLTVSLIAVRFAAGSDGAREGASASPLEPPAVGKIRVAFLVSDYATVIDFTGPWEVFQDVTVSGRGQPFELYTVADSHEAVTVTGGMRILPTYSVDDAPTPHVVVVPAMRASPRVLEWLEQVHPESDVIMSVCTGAFVLARAGLLDGLAATTHHDFHDRLAADFPKVDVRRGVRFVEGGEKISTAGGLTSGIDMALRVVERYFGRDVAAKTAEYMEYRSPSL